MQLIQKGWFPWLRSKFQTCNKMSSHITPCIKTRRIAALILTGSAPQRGWLIDEAVQDQMSLRTTEQAKNLIAYLIKIWSFPLMVYMSKPKRSNSYSFQCCLISLILKRRYATSLCHKLNSNLMKNDRKPLPIHQIKFTDTDIWPSLACVYHHIYCVILRILFRSNR